MTTLQDQIDNVLAMTTEQLKVQNAATLKAFMKLLADNQYGSSHTFGRIKRVLNEAGETTVEGKGEKVAQLIAVAKAITIDTAKDYTLGQIKKLVKQLDKAGLDVLGTQIASIYRQSKESKKKMDKVVLDGLVLEIQTLLGKNVINKSIMALLSDQVDLLTDLMDNASGSRTYGDMLSKLSGVVLDELEATDADMTAAERVSEIVDEIYAVQPDLFARQAKNWVASGKPIEIKPYVPCHKGNVKVFEFNGISIYGGADRDGGWKSTHGFNVVIGPEGIIDAIHAPTGWRISKNLPVFVPLVFPDGQAPVVYDEFWTDLIADLRERAPLNVLCMCLGGHGRTGTMLCCLYGLVHAGEFTTVDEVVTKVRDSYCQSAVESTAQMDYIAKVLGIPYEGTVKPDHSSFGGTTYVYNAKDDWKQAQFMGGVHGFDTAS